MHTTQYFDNASNTGWAFHHDGDALSGYVLINQRGLPEWETFRTTAKEIAVFLTALKLDAMPPLLTLRTTVFEVVNASNVRLHAVILAERDDAKDLLVPLTCLESFGDDLIRMTYENAMEDVDRDKILAAIGIVSFFLNMPHLQPDMPRPLGK